ncbi:MAG: PilZ domain-containing protein [Betaproteobacteria bacterium]|nr:MAG: PilZ domain-containing protein [Betaproteobacteria bacterium]
MARSMRACHWNRWRRMQMPCAGSGSRRLNGSPDHCRTRSGAVRSLPFGNFMKRRPRYKRRERRLGAALAVNLGSRSGVTHDLSASGVFFETEAAYHKGNRIHFEINLDTPWGKAVCDCDGKIVRVERRDGSLGIAVQFSEAKPRSKKPRAKVRAARIRRAKPRRRKR